MKHNLQITILLISMFLFTQFLGLYIVNSNPFVIKQNINGSIEEIPNPSLSWLDMPSDTSSQGNFYFGSMLFSFVFAVVLMFLLIKFKVNTVLKSWFFVVVVLALFLAFTALLPDSTYFLIPLILAISLAALKMFKRNIIVHNLTELLIYPGIATVFVPILNFWTAIILLVLISIYDMWAVWHSGIMQKMAKYQMNQLKVFGGFFVPYISKKMRAQIKKLKLLNKNKLKKKKIKAHVAILGGGDVVFPIIVSGVMLKTSTVNLPFGMPAFIGGIIPSLFVIFGATLGLTLLFIFSEKKKFYPAMPFISAGIFLGLILSYIVNLL